jgi:3-oxoacyl-[acyl-carrier protein] reductase
MDVNMKSCWLCTREAVPFMPAGSAIVNFSSLAARDGGGPGASLYATAKGAVMTFTRSMAKELGPQGIRVNALAPGTIATSFHDRFNTPENRERMKGVYPLRREGDAGDIADLVLFLACTDSDYLTGTNIDINGGVFFLVISKTIKISLIKIKKAFRIKRKAFF